MIGTSRMSEHGWRAFVAKWEAREHAIAGSISVFAAHLPRKSCSVAIAAASVMWCSGPEQMLYNQRINDVAAFFLTLTMLDVLNRGVCQTAIVFVLKAKISSQTALFRAVVNLIDSEIGFARSHTVQLVHWLTALFIASTRLAMEAPTRLILQRVVIVVLGVRLLFFSWRCIELIADTVVSSSFGVSHALTAPRVRSVVHLLWYPFSIAFVLAIAQNVGLELGALVAGFGVGGIALALSVKDVLHDALSAVSILWYKPFAPGDVVIVAGANALAARVERITPKYTFLRAFDGETLTYSNRDIADARVRNFGSAPLARRRLHLALPLSRSTFLDALDAVPSIAREAIAAALTSDCDKGSIQCYLESATEQCYRFEVLVVLLNVENWRAAHHRVNMALLHALAARGIELARPHMEYEVDVPGSEPSK